MPPQQPASTDAVIKALIHRYVKLDDRQATTDDAGALEILQQLPVDESTLLAERIARDWPETVLPPLVRAIVASVDDCTRMVFSLVRLEPPVEAELRRAIPAIAREVIAEPTLPMTSRASVFSILDKLVEGMIGWSEGLGKVGNKTFEEAGSIVQRLVGPLPDIEALDHELTAFIDKEQGRAEKLEERLAASETGLLRATGARNAAASMINAAMKGSELTPTIITFLQGPWYDSLQLLLINEGFDSEAWHRACKLTDTIVWTYQPIPGDGEEAEQDRQRLYRIIEHLPREIRELLVSLEHNTTAAEQALEAIENEHVLLVSGQARDSAEFEPIACETVPTGSKVSRLLLRKVNNLAVGQLFIYEHEGEQNRIKLILKDDGVRQLLFTNRNGMKALQRSFDEAAYDLTSGIIKPLNHTAVFSSTFATFYNGLVEEHARQMKRLAERRADFDQEQEAREAAHREAEANAAAKARAEAEAERERQKQLHDERLARAREVACLPENAAATASIAASVGELAIGAWLALPGDDGEPVDARLAVRISASDKLIFVGANGTKIGEYSCDQLTHLLAAGEARIQDEGVEFEDTLAAVVNKLRDDRTKSYDDLTGSE